MHCLKSFEGTLKRFPRWRNVPLRNGDAAVSRNSHDRESIHAVLSPKNQVGSSLSLAALNHVADTFCQAQIVLRIPGLALALPGLTALPPECSLKHIRPSVYSRRARCPDDRQQSGTGTPEAMLGNQRQARASRSCAPRRWGRRNQRSLKTAPRADIPARGVAR